MLSRSPATGSVIRLGVVGTFSGPVGGLVKDTINGIRVWQQYTNDNGGVNGHRVEVAGGDDGGDPARHISIQRQFGEQGGGVGVTPGTHGCGAGGGATFPAVEV